MGDSSFKVHPPKDLTLKRVFALGPIPRLPRQVSPQGQEQWGGVLHLARALLLNTDQTRSWHWRSKRPCSDHGVGALNRAITSNRSPE